MKGISCPFLTCELKSLFFERKRKKRYVGINVIFVVERKGALETIMMESRRQRENKEVEVELEVEE